MIKIQTSCQGCHCCGKQLLRPILLPEESKQFPDGQIELLTTAIGQVATLAKGKDGNCIFFTDGACSIYNRQPLECQLYPYVLDFSGWNGYPPDLRLHSGCVQLSKLTGDIDAVWHEVSKIEFNPEWVSIYQLLTDV